MSKPAELLRQLAALADPLDAAGRLIANPVRAMISRAEELAMAYAVERLQEIRIEADRLVRMLASDDVGTPEQIVRLRELLAALAGTTQQNEEETSNGKGQS